MKRLFHIDRVPSDTQMRNILDGVDPLELRPAFRDVFRVAQRGKVLDRLRFLGGCHLLLMDGTQYFHSEAIHCESCLRKEHKDGRVTYSHQMLSAVLVPGDKSNFIYGWLFSAARAGYKSQTQPLGVEKNGTRLVS